MNIYEKLMSIQSELKAPKNQHNSFGGFNYRSCEDILEAVKPICKKYNCCLTLYDKPIVVGEWHYIEATATLADEDNAITVTASAREQQEKTKMDTMQLTGATSSYARKYALNGLFCIDDTKDADTDEFKKQTSNKEEDDGNKPIDQIMIESLQDLIKNLGITKEECLTALKELGANNLRDLKFNQVEEFRKKLGG